MRVSALNTNKNFLFISKVPKKSFDSAKILSQENFFNELTGVDTLGRSQVSFGKKSPSKSTYKNNSEVVNNSQNINSDTSSSRAQLDLYNFVKDNAIDIYNIELSLTMEKTDEINIDLAKQLSADKDFPNAYIYLVLGNGYEGKSNVEKASIVDSRLKLYNYAKQKNCSPAVTTSLYGILARTNADTLESLEKELDAKIELDNFIKEHKANLNKYDQASILFNTDGKNLKLAEALIVDKKIPRDKIKFIITAWYDDVPRDNRINARQNLYLHVIKSFPNFDGGMLANILKETDSDNIGFIKLLLNDKNISDKEIVKIVDSASEAETSAKRKKDVKVKEGMYKLLRDSYSDLSGENLSKILQYVNSQNSETVKKLALESQDEPNKIVEALFKKELVGC